MLKRIKAWLLSVPTKRAPDFVVGDPNDPYLERWWLIPRNPLFNLYLHRISKDDDDRALHDHPWPSMTLMLQGHYNEISFRYPEQWPEVCSLENRIRSPGDLIFRRAKTAHRLEVLDISSRPHTPVITLFITGPVVRKWGFYCPQGWRYYRDFVAKDNPGEIGRGCA